MKRSMRLDFNYITNIYTLISSPSSLEAEHVYSKALSKMALKLNKTCREIPGSLAEAWRAVATEMESRGEVHRQFSKSLGEEIVKPLKEMLDGQHKTRKTVCELQSCSKL